MLRLDRFIGPAWLAAIFAVLMLITGWVSGLIEPERLGSLGEIIENNPLRSFGALLVVLIWVAASQYRSEKQTRLNETTELPPQLRANLLHRFKRRYNERLEDSLRHEVRVELGMQERPGVLQLDPSLRLVGEQEDRLLPPGTTVDQLFDDSGGRLLILGRPGAGKTTMMLEIARELVKRAEKDEREPVPIVINLASWAQHEGTLRKWLADALSDTAEVSSRPAQTLAQGDDLLLLLDGLDEVETSKRSACVAAINEYLGERAPRMVVCSRTHEYEQSTERLKLEKAAQIEPLTPEAFIQELKRVPETSGLRAMLREDDALRELATTPLMWSVMLLTYRGKNPPSIRENTLEKRRQALWDDYVVRMIARRRPTEYKSKDILRWLSWLAERMHQEDMTDFIPERMQPSWLTQPSSYTWTVWLAAILTSGLAGGLAGGLLFIGSSGLISGWLIVLFVGILVGIFGVPYGFSLNERPIQLQEKVEWSFRRDNLVNVLGFEVIISLIACLATGLIFGPVVGSIFGLSYWPSVVLFAVFAVLMYSELFDSVMEECRVVSYVDQARSLGERLKASRRNGSIHGLYRGLRIGVCVVFLSLGAGRFLELHFGPPFGLRFGLISGVFFCLLICFICGLVGWIFIEGGKEALKYNLLCWCLTREGNIHWHYFHFLGSASELLLLQQDGGTVRFRHLLLQDYFAGLTSERIEDLAARCRPRQSASA